MSPHNLRLFAAALLAGQALAVGDSPTAPTIDRQDKQFLSRAARRACQQYLRDQTIYSSHYTPPDLKDTMCEVIVTLRGDRLLLGIGAAGPGPIVRTTIEAAVAAARSDERNVDWRTHDVAKLLIEIEAVGSPIALDLGDGWLEPAIVDRVFEPGVDGFSVSRGGAAKRVCPSELSIKNLRASDAIKPALERLPGSTETPSLARFRSTHWYQPTAGSDVVPLRRGLTLVTNDEVTADSVAKTIGDLADYLVYRRRPSGSFAYEYEPAADAYTDADDHVHQAGAAWTLATAAGFLRRAPLLDAAGRSVEAHLARLQPIAGAQDAAFIATANERNKLGVTAQIALAMSAHPDSGHHAVNRARLALGMLWLQKPSGEFITAFPPARRLSGGDVYPGMALLALCEEYKDQPDQRIQGAFNLAFDFYRREFDRRPTLSGAMWLAQPFARMAVLANRREFARFAFSLADRLVAHQLTPATSPWPELHGGVLPNTATLPDIETAVCLAAWSEAIVAARKFGDTERVACYETAARAAARFVLQLQVRESETYHMRVVTDALGGMRTSVADNRLRLENIQYALLGLIKFHETVLSSGG